MYFAVLALSSFLCLLSLPTTSHILLLPPSNRSAFATRAAKMPSNEYNIYQHILGSNYNKNVRPDTVGSLEVLIALRFFTLLSVDQIQESMVFSGDFELQWTDTALAWDPGLFGGKNTLVVHETEVWRPDVTVYNSITQSDVIPEEQRLITINSDGSVLKSSPAIYTTRCSMDMNHFPFDTQTCKIQLSSWVYSIEEVNIESPSWLFNYSQPDYTGNSEWDLLSLKVADLDTNDTDGSTFSELEYSVTIRRHTTYYICVIFIPTFIVTTLSLIGFFTPFDNDGNRVERVTLGLTTLLSLAVMLNIVGDEMPKSANLPQLGGFVLAECLICGLAVLITIVLLFCHQRVSTRRILPLDKKKVDFPAYMKGKMGLRVLQSADGVRSLDEMYRTLEDVVYYIRNVESREELRLYWVKVFDRLDLIFLVLFQLTNLIVMLCYLLIR